MRYFYLLTILVLITSCKSQKGLTYFNDVASSITIPSELNYQITIAPDDELLITVNSAVAGATADYNLPLTNPAVLESVKTATAAPQQQTYLVNREGYISFPQIGKIHVAGMTLAQLTSYLEEEIGKNVKDPIIRVSLVNFKVNVIGEVKDPQTIKVTSERFSVLDAIAGAGDLTEYGVREKIMVIREDENGDKTFHRLDLTDANMVNSPYFYLKQNDVVYVEPNDVRYANSKYNQNNAYKVSVTSAIISGVSVVASLIIALTR